MNYSLGFLFSENRSRVVLIEKNKPEWQRGLMNGVGGKIEKGESPLEGMRREFLEETGVVIDDWRRFCDLYGKEWIVHCFASFGDIMKVESQELELIVRVTLPIKWGSPVIPNLRWLIPMALDKDILMSTVTSLYYDDQP